MSNPHDFSEQLKKMMSPRVRSVAGSAYRTASRGARAIDRNLRQRAVALRSPAPGRLTRLAIRYGTDKWGVHRYTPHYEHHLGRLVHSEFAMLEIGIGGYAFEREGGASLKMWKAFFPKARIVGLDIEDKSFVDEPRIVSYQGSQVDHEVLARVDAEQGPFAVIIDDGSHNPAHIRETFGVLFPLLSDGGVYVIEDTQTSYWPQWGGSSDPNDPTQTMGLIKDLLDGLNWEEWRPNGDEPSYADEHVVEVHAYHNLVFIVKGSNRESSPEMRMRATGELAWTGAQPPASPEAG